MNDVGNARPVDVHALAVSALRAPEGVATLNDGEWDLLVRQARRADVLGRLHALLAARGLLDTVPAAARGHLEAASRVADKHLRVVQWEITRIREALRPTGLPVVLLKGAAYVAAQLPPAAGRLFADIDIMVPKAALGKVEKQLLIHGWIAGKLDPYDQRYYRRWMHEIPPLHHRRRNTVIDVHHSILPETSRYPFDAGLLHQATVAAAGDEGLRTLAPADMVLHSATHLFCDGEFDHALRDLADIDDLLRHFGADPAFWTQLAQRAQDLGLARPLYYALEQRTRLFAALPPSELDALMRSAQPPAPARRAMQALLARAMLPDHDSCDRPFTGVARELLFMRGHYLRMPLHLLLPHLVRKAMRKKEHD